MRALGFLGLFLGVIGCGGRVVVDGAGGSPGAGGAGQGAGPLVGPSSGSVASVGVSSSIASSTSSSSTGGPSDCSAFGFHGIGSVCNDEGTTCTVAHACCGTTATCKGGMWVPSGGPDCQMPCITCHGDFACSADSVCVVDQGFSPVYQCLANPCAGQPLACSCAATLCMNEFTDCAGTAGTTVYCECPDC